VEELIERQRLAEDRNHEDREALDRELDLVLNLDEPLIPADIAEEVNDWDKDIEQQWQKFVSCIGKSGLNQRVAVEAHVRYRRAQWIQMNKEQRDLYTTWKSQRYSNAKPEEIKIRDLIMSPDCLHLPPSHYACPICWLSQTMHKESTAAGMRQHCYKAHSIQASSCYDPFTLALGRMIGNDVMLKAVFPDPEIGPRIVRGNYLQCYHPGCQEKAVNGVGMRTHLERAHHAHDSLDMGPWDIIMAHLKADPDVTLEGLFGRKQAIACQCHNCGFIGVTEKALIAHNVQQHQNDAKWAKATLCVHLGPAPPIPTLEDPVKALSEQMQQHVREKPRTVQEAQIAGEAWLEQCWQDFQNGVKENHPTRSEARRIADEGSFKKFILEEMLPDWEVFKHCDFTAQEGFTEKCLQLMRAKIRAVEGAKETMFGPRQVVSAKEMERRRAVAEQARNQYQLLKATQLVIEAINWRVSDKRLAETEYRELGLEEDDVRLKFDREKRLKTLRKCIGMLTRLVQPYNPEKPEPHIGIMPSGRSALAAIEQSYNLEGNSVEDLTGPDEVPELEKPLPVEDGEDLYYLCGKDQPEVIQAEAEQVWEQCCESQVYKTCLSIRKHVYTNTMPELRDKKKQALLEETEAQRD
jgi:hypothetical protein